MTAPLIQRFIDALHKTDQSRDTQQMVDLFADHCEISNVAIKPMSGKKGVERFWNDYCATFKDVKTNFTRVSESDGKAILEWVSEGVLQSGRPIVYEGVTILEWSNGDHIERFKAYHDSAAFLKEGGKHADVTSHESNVHPISTNKVMEGGPKRDVSTPGEGVLTSSLKDRDAATG
ncbi:MAG: nuclear transport factor 2 family protein [Bdellovibrionia bacterium]